MECFVKALHTLRLNDVIQEIVFSASLSKSFTIYSDNILLSINIPPIMMQHNIII